MTSGAKLSGALLRPVAMSFLLVTSAFAANSVPTVIVPVVPPARFPAVAISALTAYRALRVAIPHSLQAEGRKQPNPSSDVAPQAPDILQDTIQ
jgi:hypothetical protein